MSKFARRPLARPDDILDASLDLFLRRGFSDVKMSDIAARAGITAGTIYRYFDSKDALISALVERHADASWSRGKEIAEAYGSRTARDIVGLLLHRWADHLSGSSSSALLLLVVREAPRFEREVEQYTQQLLQPGCLAIERALRHGMERGEFPATLEIEGTARALAGAVLLRPIWQTTFGPHLPALSPGVDVSRLALDAVVRGLPKLGESPTPLVPPQPAPHPGTVVEGGSGLRIVTLHPPRPK
jgi:AcrR family transcriptional regulator